VNNSLADGFTTTFWLERALTKQSANARLGGKVKYDWKQLVQIDLVKEMLINLKKYGIQY